MEVPLPRRVPVALLSAVLLCAGLAVYANSFRAPFVLDDTASIVENESIRRLLPLGPALSPPANAGVGGRPIANLSFAVNYALGGLDVRGYHIVNLGIHLGAALVLFGLVRRTLVAVHIPEADDAQAVWIAFTVALLWLVHPLQTEAVTYTSQRTESLMGLCYLLTLYAFVRGVQTQSLLWQMLAVTACVIGLATKEVIVTAPLLVLLYDRTFLAGSFRAAWERRRALHLALHATWIPVLVLLRDVHERGIGYEAVTWWRYALTECSAVVQYLRLVFWPSPLVFDYGTAVVSQPADVWVQVVVLAALVAAATWAVWKLPRAGFAAISIFILLGPTSSVVPVAGQPMAEHRMYLPLAGCIVLVVTLLCRWGGRGGLAGCMLLAVPLGHATVQRNRDYHSAIALWTDTVAKRPQNARAHAALGAAWLEQGDLPHAIAELEQAVQLDPRSPEPRNNLATALQDANRTSEAIAHFEASLRLRPGAASTHYNFGNALLSVGRPAEAIAQQEQALILRRDFPEAHCALANALLAAHRVHDAITHYREALRLKPDLVAADYGLANALAQAGRMAEAVPHFEATLRAVPNSVEAHYNFGNLLLGAGRYADALPHYEAAVRLQPGFAEAHNNLANACAMLGRREDAIAHYEAALKLRPDLTAAQTNLEALKKTPRQRND